MAVGLALAAALLAVPRAAAPTVFPVPLVDVAEAAATRARFDEQADRAERKSLPFETRAVGDALRRLGSMLAGGPGDPDYLERVLQERVALALHLGQVDALAQLRAVQARLFVRAVRSQVWGQPPSAELAALGGDFAALARQNAWLGPSGCLASDDELRTLFVFRWVGLLQLQEAPSFRPSLAELRRYYRFLLLYPERPQASSSPEPPTGSSPIQLAPLRLRYVDALAKRDHDYPAALARGSLLGTLGRDDASAQALGGHLARSAEVAWRLRARNYWLHALRDAEPEP